MSLLLLFQPGGGAVDVVESGDAVAAHVSLLNEADASISQAGDGVSADVDVVDSAQVVVPQAGDAVAVAVAVVTFAQVAFTQQGDAVDTTSIIANPFASWWGPWFPARGPKSWWDGWFPEGEPDDLVPGVAPAGVGTLALVLESGVKVTYTWQTGVAKFYDGTEKRSSHVDDPVQKFDGDAYLVGGDARAMRARLARYAAIGRPFLMGLPYEELTVRADASGTTIPVFDTSESDWAVPGARVIVSHQDHGDWEGVVQSVTSDSIEAAFNDGSGPTGPGDAGKVGAVIMPAFAVFLDPQQSFARHPNPDEVERWQVRARNAIAGFLSSPVAATLSLEDPVTVSGVLSGLSFLAREAGADGNDIEITMSDDALTAGGELDEDEGAKTLHVKYLGNETTVAELIALVNNGSALVKLVGTATDTDVVASADDEIDPTNLAGGTDGGPTEVGIGATVATFADRPVWDRGIQVSGTGNDSIHSLSEAMDFGGLPFSAGSADFADWGRHLAIVDDLGAEWQWLKRFLDTVKGRFLAFWLSTYRNDLAATATGVGTLTVDNGEDGGDFFTWYPDQRDHLQVRMTDGSIVRARITSAVNNGATVTLSIVDENDDPVTLGLVGTIDMVSWLELCRMESDSISVAFKGSLFAMSTVARVVRQ